MKQALCIAALLTAGSVAAQNLDLQYQGRIVEVVDPLGLFSGINLGLAADGIIGLDLGADDQFDGTIPASIGFNLGLFAATAFVTEIADVTFEGVDVVAVVADNLPLGDNGEPLDFFVTQGSVFSGDFSGLIKSTFNGGDDLFTGTTIGIADTLTLSNLESAEVTIEFTILNDGVVPGPDLTPDDVTTSRVTIQIINLSSGGSRIADLVCPADTNENSEVDFGDLNAWVALYNLGDFRADINRDGQITPADFGAWIVAFNNGC